MIIKINRENIGIKEQLDKFAQTTTYGNAFHRSKMIDFFQSVPNCFPKMISVLDKSGKIKGFVVAIIQREKGFIKKRLSTRAIVFSGPVLDTLDQNIHKYLKEILKTINGIIKKEAIYIEFRNFNDYSKYRNIFEEYGYTYHRHYNFYIDCTDKEQMMGNMSTSRKRNIKQSLKEGAKIITPESEKDITDFYNILKRLYKEKVKKPLPPKEFFINFYRQKAGKYFLIKYRNEIIGGIMCPILKDRVIYELYLAGDDKKYKKIYPSVLATYAAMQYAHDQGIPRFDLMGAGRPHEEYGVRQFKERFGGKLVEHGRFIKINKPLLYKIGKLGIKISGKIK